MAPTSFQVGQRTSRTRTITEEDIVEFARVSGDTNPLHLDDEYARTTRFGRRVAHGLWSAGLISALLGTELPGPGAIYLKQSLQFLRPAYPGDTITATVEVTGYRPEKRLLTLRTVCTNQDGEQVLDGEALVMVE